MLSGLTWHAVYYNGNGNKLPIADLTVGKTCSSSIGMDNLQRVDVSQCFSDPLARQLASAASVNPCEGTKTPFANLF